MFTYDILILAHPADAEAARRLGDSIAGYRLPRRVRPADTDNGYRHILTDARCEPFSPAAAAVLDGCRRLIVLCSPDARDSTAIRDRLLYAERTRGRASIIPVILRGEPLDAFLPFFIEERHTLHILPDGSVEERRETLEPVASDLRAQSRRQARALLRYETVRIVASVLGLEPDALQQRHQKRARRRAIAVAAAVGAVCVAVTGVLGYFSAVAKAEGDTAAAMTEESMRVIDRLMYELPARFADDPVASAYVDQIVFEAMDILKNSGVADTPSAP